MAVTQGSAGDDIRCQMLEQWLQTMSPTIVHHLSAFVEPRPGGWLEPLELRSGEREDDIFVATTDIH